MSSTSYARITATIFCIVAAAHLSRLVFHWPLEIGHDAVPVWFSGLGLCAAGTLSAWGFALGRGAERREGRTL